MAPGDCGSHSCSIATRFNLHVAAELRNSFSHACDANPNRLCARRMIQHSMRDPLTAVTNRYDQAIRILLNFYLGLAGFRMEMNVCETRLHNAEDCKFGFFRESAQFMTYLHFDM